VPPCINLLTFDLKGKAVVVTSRKNGDGTPGSGKNPSLQLPESIVHMTTFYVA